MGIKQELKTLQKDIRNSKNDNAIPLDLYFKRNELERKLKKYTYYNF